jgi:succinate dehydrogenase / fumarate reductase cytochrome b subunit
MSDHAVPPLPGAAERAERGPVHRKGAGPAFTGWFDPRGRALGARAFAINRLAGLGLVLYLYLHLGVLTLLLFGASVWGEALRIASSRTFLVFDLLLLFGLLFHGLNGIRVALVGSGIAVRHQRALFWACAAIGTIALAFAAVRFLGGE